MVLKTSRFNIDLLSNEVHVSFSALYLNDYLWFQAMLQISTYFLNTPQVWCCDPASSTVKKIMFNGLREHDSVSFI